MSDTLAPPSWALVDPLISAALAEDLGAAGDITTTACIPPDSRLDVMLRVRKPGTVAGIAIAARVFQCVDPTLDIDPLVDDGARVAAGADLLRIHGNARSILTAERVALNFAGHLSGIATATTTLVAEAEGTKAVISCTRKTTPGLRVLEKYAVRCGGGVNHRFGLYDAVLIKDNHLAATGSIPAAVAAARASVGHLVKVEVEVDTLAQLTDALAAQADVILLDNFSVDDLRAAVGQAAGRAVLEASGNITVATVRAVAQTGVDVISSGAITHSAPTLDLGLDAV